MAPEIGGHEGGVGGAQRCGPSRGRCGRIER